jgi:hypothetical protein
MDNHDDIENADSEIIRDRRCPEISWREACKAYCPDIYGWSGSVAVLTAYGLSTIFDGEEEEDLHLQIDLLNLYGSSAIGYVCWKAKVWQAFSLEVAWFGIAMYSLCSR